MPSDGTHASGARCLSEVKDQERAKRGLEIAAAGRHHMLLVSRPGILPARTPHQALEAPMIHSLAGLLDEGGISRTRPLCEPHYTAFMAAIVGGGRGAKRGKSVWPITACCS